MERYTVANMKRRLAGLRAEYKPDRSTDRGHIYWSPTTQRWIKVVRRGPDLVELTLHTTCPCANAA